ncbi:MAG: head-tail connector protein [Hyphomicrobiaceae bacterium]
MILTLEEMKAQLNVTVDTDDALIERKIAAAQSYLEASLGYAIEERYPENDEVSPPASTVPPALVEAVALLAAHLYENREATLVGVSAQELPLGVWSIVDAFRDWSWSDDDE